MRAAADWVPMQWPASWDAGKLQLVRGTAINCLVGGPKAEGFDSPADTAGVTQRIEKAPWPGVPPKGWESAGPTGNPWIDTNGWQVRLAAAKAPGKPVWVCSEKPQAENLALAVADAAHGGGRWLLQLTDELAAGIAAGNGPALGAWREAVGAIAFFERHRDWARMPATAKLAIVSAFTDTNAGEVLNLATRRHLAYRVVEKSAADSFQGLEGVLYLDEEAPGREMLGRMMEFAKAGGLLMAPRATAARITGVGPVVERQQRTVVHRLGKGRLAMPVKEWDDPFLLASDAHLLLSYRHDPVRLFNAGLLIPYVTGDGKRTVVQMVNYAGRASANFVVLGIPEAARNPRIWLLGAEGAAAMEIHREPGRPELHLPPFENYAAIEFEG